jgi:hypothetical protein
MARRPASAYGATMQSSERSAWRRGPTSYGRKLAALRRVLEDLEHRSRRMPGYGRDAIERDMDHLRREIVDLEAAHSLAAG